MSSLSQDVPKDVTGACPSRRNDLSTINPSATSTQPPNFEPSEGQSEIPSRKAPPLQSLDESREQFGLYDFAEELYQENPPVEPWFTEGSRLRRIYILWLNKQLALCRKQILECQQPTDQDMEQLGKIFHLQGKLWLPRTARSLEAVTLKVLAAEAARDLQCIRSLSHLTSGAQERLYQRTLHYFPQTAKSLLPHVQPFETDNYRRFETPNEAKVFDGVREVLRKLLPREISWSKEEKASRKDLYEAGIYAPERLSDTADRLARFIVAMGGALFILVPMYVMALRQNPVKNLVTTTVAVVLFALVCSIPLRLANDQTFSATVGYAAVLMVFVGLTSGPS